MHRRLFRSNDYNYYDASSSAPTTQTITGAKWADDWCDGCYAFYRDWDDTQLILDGVTLFDQHPVDKLTFVNYDDGFSLEHVDGACLDTGGDAAGYLQRHLRRLGGCMTGAPLALIRPGTTRLHRL